MIQINNLNKSFGRQIIFDNVSVTINSGEKVGFVGRNGAGKTTLFKMILGEEHPDSGSISIPQDYRIGYLSQYLRFTEATVLNEACLSLRPDESGADETYKVKKVLEGLGFTKSDLDSSPNALSGGYQIRLNLAKVLVSEPNMLLLDEPTNYLDIVSIRWLIKELKAWTGELILITHDRDFMDSVTTHTMAIHRFKLRKMFGPAQKLFDQILLEEEVYEKTRINDEKKRKDVEQFINRFRAQANKAKAVQSRIKALQRHERLEQLTDMQTLDFAFNAAPFMGKQLLTAEKVTFGFENGPLLINGLDLAIGKRDRIAVIGKNGKGKTTLLNLLAGEISPLSGSITMHSATKIAYFGQTNINRLNLSNTIEQEIMDVHPDNSRGASRRICGIMMFEGDNALKKISVLSGGEKSRVLLGKILVSPANLLLLDEPTNHLDMESVDSLVEAIDAFDGAVVIVTHSELVLNAVAERLVIFDDDKIRLFEGTYKDFLDKIGWHDEAETTTLQYGGSKDKRASRKDIRKLRADIITKKSKVLTPIQNKVQLNENEIIELEAMINEWMDAIQKASVKGDGVEIQELSIKIHDAQKKIETLFNELEELTAEMAIKDRAFKAQLDALEADA